jgi:hypothetical protein
LEPLAIDLFCGLGGWTEGLLAEGYYVVGFDIERHVYGDHAYPAQLVLQDVTTLHGSQFKDAALIVASPPCQAYSYRAMPWKRAKALPPPDNTLFETCFRIQREACEAAGRHVPMVVENVRGAQKWVGRARWHYGSYYLWGDVPALMPFTAQTESVDRHTKNDGSGWRENGTLKSCNRMVPDSVKVGSVQDPSGKWAVGFNVQACRDLKAQQAEERRNATGKKTDNGWFGPGNDRSPMRLHSSKSTARKAASAMIAKIPFRLARWIAATYYPAESQQAI